MNPRACRALTLTCLLTTILLLAGCAAPLKIISGRAAEYHGVMHSIFVVLNTSKLVEFTAEVHREDAGFSSDRLDTVSFATHFFDRVETGLAIAGVSSGHSMMSDLDLSTAQVVRRIGMLKTDGLLYVKETGGKVIVQPGADGETGSPVVQSASLEAILIDRGTGRICWRAKMRSEAGTGRAGWGMAREFAEGIVARMVIDGVIGEIPRRTEGFPELLMLTD